jgi:hypothetical protein
VEDVKAYVNFIKQTVGITHEDELVQAIKVLADKVHPLALGNVERFLSQSRMIARKILRTHMSETEDHIINEIVENMASKLFFHGHPINRQEAKTDLKLKVQVDLKPALEVAVWGLYKDYEEEFQNSEIFHPAGDLAVLRNQQPPPQPGAPQPIPNKTYKLLHALVESARLSSVFTTERQYWLMQAQPGQMAIREDVLSQGWNHSPVP